MIIKIKESPRIKRTYYVHVFIDKHLVIPVEVVLNEETKEIERVFITGSLTSAMYVAIVNEVVNYLKKRGYVEVQPYGAG